MKKQLINAIVFFAAASKEVKKATEDVSTQIVRIGDKNVELSKLDDMLEEMEYGEELTTEYFDIALGEEKRCVVIGSRVFKTKEEDGKPSREINAILLYCKGKKYIAAQAMLVANLAEEAKKAKDTGVVTPVVIVYESNEKAAVGKYAKFSITYLQPKG
jgi:hypothetical protein